MEFKRIDEAMVMEGRGYIPLMEKAAFVDYAAQRCFDQLDVRFDGEGLHLPVAPMYKENTQLKSRYLMGALVKLYLGQAYEPVEGDDWLMSADDYDRWTGGNPLGQLEQMEGHRRWDIQEWALAVRRDFADLRNRLDREVTGLLAVMNDPIGRFIGTMQAQTTPEMFRRGTEELQRLKEELETYQKDAEKAGEREDGGE